MPDYGHELALRHLRRTAETGGAGSIFRALRVAFELAELQELDAAES